MSEHIDDSLTLVSLSLRNFFSYGNAMTTIDLMRPGTTLIVGVDLTTGTSNGTGKSTILNGILYALYDRCLSDELKLDEMINNYNKKDMAVGLKFKKRGVEYEVWRYRKGREGNTVKLFINGELKTLDSVSRTNKYIEEQIVGYSYDLFARIVIFSAGHKPFFELPTYGAKKPLQSDIIEELFSITLLSQKADVLKEEIKDNERKLEVAKVRVDYVEKEKQRHETLIDGTKSKVEQWIVAHKERVETIQKQIERINKIDYAAQESIWNAWTAAKSKLASVKATYQKLTEWNADYHTKTEHIMQRLHKIEGIDFDLEQSLRNDLAIKTSEVKELTAVLKDNLRKEKDNLATMKAKKEEHSHLYESKCPYCLQDFAGAAEKISAIKSDIESLESVLVTIKVSKESTQDKILTLEDSIDTIKAKMMPGDLTALLQIKNDSETLKARLEELRAEVNPHLQTLQPEVEGTRWNVNETAQFIGELRVTIEDYADKLVVSSLDECRNSTENLAVLMSKLESTACEVNPHTVMLDELSGIELEEPNYDEANDLQKIIEHQKFLVKLLTKTDSFVRKAIIDKNIPFLNQRMRENLIELGLTHKVEFTNTMTASITQLGRPISYHGLSMGQRARINLALAFAFRDVLQKMHSPINFCLLDEVLDVGLCPIGIAHAVRMLKNKAKRENLTMFTISHKVDIDSSFDSKLRIEFSNGFSKVIQ